LVCGFARVGGAEQRNEKTKLDAQVCATDAAKLAQVGGSCASNAVLNSLGCPQRKFKSCNLDLIPKLHFRTSA